MAKDNIVSQMPNPVEEAIKEGIDSKFEQKLREKGADKVADAFEKIKDWKSFLKNGGGVLH